METSVNDEDEDVVIQVYKIDLICIVKLNLKHQIATKNRLCLHFLHSNLSFFYARLKLKVLHNYCTIHTYILF